MKKFICFLIIIILLMVSFCFAMEMRPINVQLHKWEAGDLQFPDLLLPDLDDRGRQLHDREGDFWKFHPYTNEILKASLITIDKDDTKLINGILVEEEVDDVKTQRYEFRPNDNIKKGEFMKMAIGLATNRNFDYSIIPNPAPQIRHWSSKFVRVAELQGVVEKGDYNDDNLDEPITRIEMVKILTRVQTNMKGLPQFRDGNLDAYTDIEESQLSEEEKGYILHAKKFDLIPNMSYSDTFDPYANVTRGEAARAIIRIY